MTFVPLFLYMYWFDIYMLLRHTLANIIFACLNIFDGWIDDKKKSEKLFITMVQKIYSKWILEQLHLLKNALLVRLILNVFLQ